MQELAAAISHDLRAPLRALDGFSRAVMEQSASELDGQGPPDSDERSRHLGFIRESSRRLGQQIEAVVGLCRLSTIELRVQPVDLTALARSVIAELAAGQPGREVEVEVEDGLAASGDPELLRVLLVSLIGNAWKYTEGAAEARIRIGQRREGERQVFFVTDSGAGFSMNGAERLFRPFTRLHPPALFPGLGVGLARARRVVVRHGGRIWAESSPDTGATFRFVLGDPI